MQVPGTRLLLIKYVNFNKAGVGSSHHTVWKRDPFLFSFPSYAWNVWFDKLRKLKLGSQQPWAVGIEAEILTMAHSVGHM